MAAPKLLIVDDDPGVRTQLKWGLEGYEVLMAESRQDALEQFGQHYPPLVTLDLGLPPDAEGTDEGYAALKEIISMAPDTKVVVVSGSGIEANAEKAKQEGAYEFFAKPVNIESLQAIIERAFKEFQLENSTSS